MATKPIPASQNRYTAGASHRRRRRPWPRRGPRGARGGCRLSSSSSVTIRLGSTHGANLQVRAGTTPAGLHVVASAADAGGPVRLSLASHPHVRYLLIWFTRLPPDAAGTYQAYISNVTVTAYAK